MFWFRFSDSGSVPDARARCTVQVQENQAENLRMFAAAAPPSTLAMGATTSIPQSLARSSAAHITTPHTTTDEWM